MNLTYIVQEKDNFLDINDLLKRKFKISTRLLSKLIKSQNIYVNNKFVNTNTALLKNDEVIIDFSYEEDNSNVLPNKMDLNILYEDDWFLILDKPAGVAIHPSMLHYDNSLTNGVRYYFTKIDLKKKIRPVNRLDSNTSGIVIFAKCEYIQESLVKQMGNNTFKKEYLCFCENLFDKKIGTIDLPISRKENSIIERCIDENGQKSITHYEVLEEYINYSLVKCILETGRTHQIRVHMSAISHPIIGDTLYGNPSSLINRQALHSSFVSFIHPISNEIVEVKSPLPLDIEILKTKLS